MNLAGCTNSKSHLFNATKFFQHHSKLLTIWASQVYQCFISKRGFGANYLDFICLLVEARLRVWAPYWNSLLFCLMKKLDRVTFICNLTVKLNNMRFLWAVACYHLHVNGISDMRAKEKKCAWWPTDRRYLRNHLQRTSKNWATVDFGPRESNSDFFWRRDGS